METTKHYSLRFVAAILSIAIALMSLPLTVFADELGRLLENQETEAVAEKELFEVVEKRTATSKTFRLEDGSFYIAQYDSDIHYLDENGVWQEIDNTLTAYGSEISTKNAKIKFLKKTNGSNKIFTIQNGDQKLTLSLIGANKKVTGKVTNHQTEFDDKATKLEKMTTLDRVNASVLYEEILKDTDLEYVVSGVNIKENIIVKAKQERYCYSFELQLNNLTAELTEKGEIRISDSSQPVYLIPAPVMWDSAHRQSDLVSFELANQGNGKYILTVNADPEWINADERVFPVTIDPPIYSTSSSPIVDLDIDSATPDSSNASSDSLCISSTRNAYWKLTELPSIPRSAYISEAKIHMDLQSIDNMENFDSYIGVYEVLSNWDAGLSWNKAHASTNPQGKSDNNYTAYLRIQTHYSGGEYGVLNYGGYEWNITPIVKKWYEGRNYGVRFAPIPNMPFTSAIRFYSNEYENSAMRPQLCITYRDMRGLEDYWSFSSQNAGLAGVGYVNNATGNLIFSIPILTTTDYLMPFTLTCVYQSARIYDLDAQSPFGLGVHLNINETVRFYQTIQGKEYYIYRDGDGTDHYFKQRAAGSAYYDDEDGLQLTLQEFGTPICYIEDANHNVRTFDAFEGGSYLVKITDQSGNSIQIARDNNGIPQSVKLKPVGMPAITQLNFSYNDVCGTILSEVKNEISGETVKFYYREWNYATSPLSQILEGALSRTEYLKDGNIQATMDYAYSAMDGELLSVTNGVTGYSLKYQYDGYGRVESITESANGNVGQKQSFTYSTNGTVVRSSGEDDIYGTSDDLLTTYGFDEEGRTISCYTTDLNYSTLYGASNGRYVGEDNPNAKNKLKSSVQTTAPSSNYLLNGGFENGALYWNTVGDVRFGYDAYEGRGAAALCLNSSTSRSTITQNVLLHKGQYTVTLFIKTAKASNVDICLRAESLSNPDHTVSRTVPINEYMASSGYVITELTFSSEPMIEGDKESFAISVSCDGIVSQSVQILVDDFMLSKTNGATSFDMVQMGHFDYTSGVKTPFSFWSYDGSSEDAFFISETGDPIFEDALRIGPKSFAGNGTIDQVVYRADDELKARYDAGEYDELPSIYTLSGWGKGTKQSYALDSSFSIIVGITYYDGNTYGYEQAFTLSFNRGITDWQFVSGGFATDPSHGIIDKITVSINYWRHPGIAYFDSISLVKDSNNTNLYFYNDNGDLDRYQNNHNVIYYQYNSDGDVTREVSTKNTIVEYKYDSHHRATMVTTKTYTGDLIGFNTSTQAPVVSGLIKSKNHQVYEYNNYGQQEKILTYDSSDLSKYVSTVKNYLTTEGSHIFGALISETNTSQMTTRYFYDDATGRLLATISSNGKGVAYEYDAFGNLTRTIPAILEICGGEYNYYTDSSGSAVEFSYSSIDQRLSSIQTKSTIYHFYYDVFGNTTEISAGSHVLADYSYNDYNGKLKMLTYGNGVKVQYEYDDLDRIKEVWYNTGEDGAFEIGYSYAYNSSGQLHSVTDHFTNETTVYQYNLAGQLVKAYAYDTETFVNLFGTRVDYDSQSRISRIVHALDYTCPAADYHGTTYSDSSQYLYRYDDATGYLSRLTFSGDHLSGYVIPEYDVFGRTVGVEIDFKANGSDAFYNQIDFSYENGSHLSQSALVSQIISEIRKGTGTELLSSATYNITYDEIGNITQITDANGVIQNKYYYDSLGQLVREDNRSSNNSYVYQYDNAGNIIAKKRYTFTTGTLGTVLSTYSYTYGDSTWGDLLTKYDGTTIEYDEIGNPIFIGRKNEGWYDGYELQWQGRSLIACRYVESYGYGEHIEYTDELSCWYTYNADGIRTSKTVGNVKHNYYLDGAQIVAETWTQSEIDYLLYYLYDEKGAPLGMRYRTSDYEAGVFDAFFFEKNANGDIIAIYNSTGKKIGTYKYDAWGNCTFMIRSNISSLENLIVSRYNPFRYRGYYYDVETGFYYLQSRYYNPEWGRFLNADGYVSTATGLLGYNMFAYCNNNPVMFVDPTGEAWWHWALAAAVVVACAAATVATCGMSLGGAAMAISMVASGSAALTTASTVAAAATIGSALTLGALAISAAANSTSIDDFNEQGDWGTVMATTADAAFGGVGAYLGAQGAKFTAKSNVASTIQNDVIDTPRVRSALKSDPYHSFPDIVDNYAGYATKSSISNGTLYQLQGSLNGRSGRFEWIIQDQKVMHRMFVPGGGINGIPIIP